MSIFFFGLSRQDERYHRLESDGVLDMTYRVVSQKSKRTDIRSKGHKHVFTITKLPIRFLAARQLIIGHPYAHTK